LSVIDGDMYANGDDGSFTFKKISFATFSVIDSLPFDVNGCGSSLIRVYK
jgi:hypothetical protein